MITSIVRDSHLSLDNAPVFLYWGHRKSHFCDSGNSLALYQLYDKTYEGKERRPKDKVAGAAIWGNAVVGDVFSKEVQCEQRPEWNETVKYMKN